MIRRPEDYDNFSYGPDGTVSDRRYRKSAYRLSEVQRVWYGVSHFGSWGLAHSFVSFEFAEGRHLALSIEARQTVGQDYHPLVCLFGTYELIVVAGTVRDVIGLRSHLRGERVYLYPIAVPRESVELLLQAMIARIDQTHERFELNHTITDNCAMEIWRYYEEMSAFERFTNPKLLLPGFSDEVALGRGLIAGNGTIEDLRRSAQIDASVVALDDAAFSARIRGF